MAEGSQETTPPPTSPTQETIRHYRHQIKERFPDAEKTIRKAGGNPETKEGRKLRVSIAADKLRTELESDTDPLTGLLNLRGFRKRLKQERVRAHTYGHKTSIASVDMDELKRINDTEGHEAGDNHLIKIARALTGSSRISDIVARTGGDEFRVLLTETDVEDAQNWKERVEETLDKENVHASIGLAKVNGFEDAEVDASLREADEKMYDEKRKYKKSKQPSLNILQKTLHKISSVLRRT